MLLCTLAVAAVLSAMDVGAGVGGGLYAGLPSVRAQGFVESSLDGVPLGWRADVGVTQAPLVPIFFGNATVAGALGFRDTLRPGITLFAGAGPAVGVSWFPTSTETIALGLGPAAGLTAVLGPRIQARGATFYADIRPSLLCGLAREQFFAYWSFHVVLGAGWPW